jgi:type I restriction enzyme S subunit
MSAHPRMATSAPRNAKLGDLLTVIRGVTYKKENATKEPAKNRIPILRATNIQKGIVFEDLVYVPLSNVSEEQRLRRGDIVIAASSGSRSVVGKAAQLNMDWEGSFGTFCFGLRPKPHVEPGYLGWFLQTSEYRNQVSELSAGVNINNLKAIHIEEIPIHVPTADVQRSIVAEIEKHFTRLEAGVAALKRVQANLKRYRASVLKAACEGRLVPTEAELARAEGRSYEPADQLLARILIERRQKWSGRGNYKEPITADTSALPQLPQGWMWASLDAAIIAGPQNGVYLPGTFYGKGDPILRIDDFQNGWIRAREELNKVTADSQTVSTYQLEEGDFVINRVNSMTHLGKCVLIRESHSGALFESNMMRCHLASLVDPFFVELYLHSREGISRLTQTAKWAVNQASINQQDVKKTALPLPPLNEQRRIVAEVERRLSIVDQLEAIVTSNLQRATRLRQSILQKAFSGKLKHP